MTDQKNVNSQDFFTRLSDTRQHLIALFILFIIPFFLFTATTIGGKEFQRHDTTQWRAATESVFEYRETYDKEPLWVNNMFGGMPSYVVSLAKQTPHLDDLHKLFDGIFPAFQFWVLFSGMYFLLVLMKFRPLSATFGSLMFGLTTYIPIIIAAGHNTKFITLTFIPWVIAGYWLLTRNKQNKLPGLLLFTVALVLNLRANHPQITYYFIYLLGFLWIFDTWTFYKKGEIGDWAKTTGLLSLSGIVALMGHAETLLPLQEYSNYSLRGGSALSNTTGLSEGYAFAWSQGIRETWTLLVPNYFGGASPEYWGPKSFTSGPHYLGALSLPFILLALVRQRSRAIYVFFSVGTLGILFSWGGNFRFMNEFAFDYIPLFDKFRAPETWLTLTAFCYTVVAVYGLDWLINFISDKKSQIKKLYVPIGLSAAVILLVFVQLNSTDFTKQGEVANIANQIAQQNQVSPNNPQVQQRAEQYVNAQMVPQREEKAKSDLLRLSIIFVLGTGLIYLAFAQKIPLSVALFGFILITAYDMINVDKRYIPENVIVDSNRNTERLLESQRTDLTNYIIENNSINTNYPYRTFPLLDNPYSNAIPSYFYPQIGGYTGAKLSVIQDVMYNGGPLDVQSNRFNSQLLDLFNVKYLTYTSGLPLSGFVPVFEGERGVVYENQNVLPKAFFVDSVITVESPQLAFDYIQPQQINLAETAVVETTDQLTTSSDSTSTIEVTTYTGPEVTLEVSRSEPGFLVLSEVYYPAGWVATLNGQEITIYKTDYFLRGLEIPAGEHQIELRFEPQSYILGTTLAWISLGFQVLLAGFIGFRSIKKQD